MGLFLNKYIVSFYRQPQLTNGGNMDQIIWIIIISQALVCAIFCSFVAGEKNRSAAGWFFNGFFFSFIALIAVSGIPIRIIQKREESSLTEKDVKVQLPKDSWECARCGMVNQNIDNKCFRCNTSK
jgi:hypothetical protein